MGKEVKIDQFTITRLLANTALVSLLPPLQELAKKKNVTVEGSCKPCGGRKTVGPSSSDKDAALRGLADYLTGNPAARAEVIRRLGGDSLRIRYHKVNSQMFIDKKLYN